MEYGLVLVWFLAYAALAALALPASAALFSRFSSRGAGLALPVALATIGVVAYWVGRFSFGVVSLLAGLAVLGGLSGLALYRGVEFDRRGYAEAMAVFGVAFLFMVAVRALDPAVHPGGGEKFLDFGMLASLSRTAQLPPEDFWFAGKPVQYYYGGHMIASQLSTLTLTPPRYAYNLAHAGYFGTLVTAAYALASAVAADRNWSRRTAGAFAAFFVGFASNLLTPARLLARLGGVQNSLADLDPRRTGVDDLVAGYFPNRPPAEAEYWTPGKFSYWDASRVIDGTINEFPLFGYINGDMHAHMMSMGFVLLVAGVLYAYWKIPPSALRHRRVVVFGVLPALVGLLAVVNTWSFPTAVGLVWLGLVFAPTAPRDLLPFTGIRTPEADRSRRADGGHDRSTRTVVGPGHEGPTLAGEAVRTGAAVAVAGIVAVLGVVIVNPYFTGATSGRGIGIVSDRSTLWGLLLVHGAFLAITVRFLLPRTDPGPGRRLPALVFAALLAVPFVAVGLFSVVPFVLVLVVGWALLRAADDVGFETALAVGAVGIVVVAEFLFVSGRGNPTRYNTVFKTYADVWILWSVAAAVMLAEYVDPAGWVNRLREGGSDGSQFESVPVGGILAAVLVVTLSLYGGLALAGHLEQAEARGPATLDSLRFVEQSHSAEADAIAWIRENVEGQPNIVTAPTRGVDMYQWSPDFQVKSPNPPKLVGGSAPASLTGVPTLAGWQHEVGYRGQEAWNTRLEDVRIIYDGPPGEQVRHLAAYEVEYIYVGPTERQRYQNTNFAQRLTGVEVAYRDEYVTIYRVDQDELGVAGEK